MGTLPVVAALDPLEIETFLDGSALHLGEQVVDYLVALSRDPDLPSPREKVCDQPGTAVCLARPGRPLDNKVRALEPIK